jgi:hypothetical protein
MNALMVVEYNKVFIGALLVPLVELFSTRNPSRSIPNDLAKLAPVFILHPLIEALKK